MTATAALRALELPEIVYRIGWFVTLWQSTKYGKPELHAKDLLSCLQVNWLWKMTLTPLLWTLCVGKNEHEIPEAVIHANRHHIRHIYLDDYMGPIQHIHVTQLKGLTLLSLQESFACRNLLLSNPNLQQMSLVASVFVEQPIESESFNQFLQALQSLTKLEHLDMTIHQHFALHEKIDTTLLRTILLKNPGLKVFSFCFHRPLARCGGWESLPWIERLAFTTDKVENGALQLLQHCPNISSLKLFQDSACPWDDVYLAMGGGGRYDWSRDDPPDYKALMILKTTTALVTLKLIFNDFVDESCEDIIDNCSNTLQNLTEYRYRIQINKILRSCPELRRLSIMTRYFSQLWFYLFEPRWDAPRLESVKFKFRVAPSVVDYTGDSHDHGDLVDLGLTARQQEAFISDFDGLMISNNQPFAASSQRDAVPDIYKKGLDAGLTRPAVDKLKGIAERYSERERQLIASIKDNGWRVSSDQSKLDTTLDLQRFRGLLLETALTMPNLRTVHLNSAVFDRV
ncbi:hypothetical protein BGZ94_002944 [Podila epigama]|nr:hypothetical protein BGZ94_002944 [Podila epigama]